VAKKYWICIEPSDIPGEEYLISFSKRYGDHYSGVLGAKSKEEALEVLRRVVDEWEGYDSVLQRRGDKVTPRNTDLEVLAPGITAEEIIGAIKGRRRA